MKTPPAIFDCRRSRRSFVLLEIMLGVLIFSVGVLALGQAVSNCISAEAARADDDRARLALENRMAEIESGEQVVKSSQTDQLTGMFDGITLKQTRTPLQEKNEKNQPIDKLFNVTLEATWTQGNQPQSKSISFYVYRASPAP
jgi:Tfp pilus assembly protein PilV